MSKRVIFINRFYDPDISATAQILTKVAVHLAEHDLDIVVVTSRQSYDGKEEFQAREVRSGVSIHRLWTTRFGRKLLPGRLADYMSFYVSAMFWVMAKVNNKDVVIIKTDPPLLPLLITLPLRWKKAKIVNWLQDIFPEVATVLGWSGFKARALDLLKVLRNRSLRASDRVVAIGGRMAERVQQMDVPLRRLEIIENFVDQNSIRPIDPVNNPLRTEWGIAPDQLCIGYSGNLGRAHDLETIWKASYLYQSIDPKIAFLFIGGGALRDVLQERLARQPRHNILLKPYQPEHLLSRSLSVADVHWLSLKPELEGLIVPSKFYAIAASGRPAIFIGDRDGEIARRLQVIGGGITVAEGDVNAMLSAIDQAKDASWRALAGKNMRKFSETNASEARRLSDWHRLVRSLQ